MNLAVIPARGGSKRIPRKNIKEFCGLPMIVHSIRAAQRSGLFDRIVISTDDAEIASVARDAGGEAPFIRPADLSDDKTPTAPVIAHALNACEQLGWHARYACCIYPCAPLIRASDMAAAYEMLVRRGARFVYPVTKYAHPTQRAMRMLNGQMEFVSPQFETTRTQDLEPTFHDCGMFYWGESTAWLSGGRMHSEGLGMPIPRWRVEDIDDEDDWARAEILFRCLSAESKGAPR